LTDSATVPVAHECSLLTSIISKVPNVSWNGTLLSARLRGHFKIDYLFGSGVVQINFNDINVFSGDASGVAERVIGFDVDVFQWMQGTGKNQSAVFQWSGIPITALNFCVDADLVISATGTITSTGGGGIPWTTIELILIAGVIIIVLAVAGGLFFRAKG